MSRDAKRRGDDGLVIEVPRVAYRDAVHRLELLVELHPTGVRILNRPWRVPPSLRAAIAELR